jgi:hypothetical protein
MVMKKFRFRFLPKKKGISLEQLAGWCMTPQTFEMEAGGPVTWTYGDGNVFMVRGPKGYHLVEVIESRAVEDGVHDRTYRTLEMTPYSLWEKVGFWLEGRRAGRNKEIL